MRIWYRVRQALTNLRARMEREDWRLVNEHLSSQEMKLFVAMAAPDQRHSVDVLRSLMAGGVQDTALLKVALLHDVGKSRCRIGLVHRTLAVISTGLLGSIPEVLTWQLEGSWWLPFYVIQNHPRIGAGMLVSAGCEERVWRLTELHHTDPRLLYGIPDSRWILESMDLLHRADNEN